jgi:LPXTG-motif cell wall-anchored protein
MRSSRLHKVLTVITLTAAMLLMMTSNAFAVTTYLVQDGTFTNAGFINAGEAKDGTIVGPGNWTQLNLGDAAVDAPYLHVIIKATGDTVAAQIAVSDLYTFQLADLGVTLTEEYQDVVLPVQEKGIAMLSWLNCMGLDGGSSVYTVKDVFLSDDAASTISAPVTIEVAPVEDAAPKTGDSVTIAMFSALAMLICAGGYLALKKYRKAL